MSTPVLVIRAVMPSVGRGVGVDDAAIFAMDLSSEVRFVIQMVREDSKSRTSSTIGRTWLGMSHIEIIHSTLHLDTHFPIEV